MRKITVAVPEDGYRDAKLRAAERGTSVSALVAEFLCSRSARDTEFARLLAQQRAVQDAIVASGPAIASTGTRSIPAVFADLLYAISRDPGRVRVENPVAAA